MATRPALATLATQLCGCSSTPFELVPRNLLVPPSQAKKGAENVGFRCQPDTAGVVSSNKMMTTK